MHILSTVNKTINSKFQIPNSKKIPNPNYQNSKHIFWLLVILGNLTFAIGSFNGCTKNNNARDYAGQSEYYYQKAVTQYQNLIQQGKDRSQLYLGLGKLYYQRGEFEKAIEAFRGSSATEAKKFLAISSYRAGNFVDALDIFNQQEIKDDEYSYYQGLTCEKLNLFDQALAVYGKITDARFKAKAKKQINLIEKNNSSVLRLSELDPKLAGILAAAPSLEQYPQAGALILSCDENIEITPQGKEISTLHYLIKILNQRGKEDFSETQISYDSTFEKVELEFARTIKPDGTIAEVGSRHIRDVSRYLNFPLYSNARVYIISFPEITEGAVIEYKLKIYNNHLINDKDFVLGYTLQEKEPVIAARFAVSLPKDRPLYIKLLNMQYNDFGAKLTPQKEAEKECLVYQWQFQDIPQIMPEANMPPLVEIDPALLLSTFNNWQEIYQWWWGLAGDKMKADIAIKNKVQELTKDCLSEEDMARAIYHFCAQKIRYVAVEYGQAGYEPHQAEDIFRNKYGDCKDQAILLVTMLGEAGLSAAPVLIPTKEDYNLSEDFPSVLFDHCIAVVFLKEKTVFMDPTAETCSFGDLPPSDQGRKVLIFKYDGYEIKETPLYPAKHNSIKQQLLIKINPDESIQAEKINLTCGFYDQMQRYWLLYTQPELIEEELKEKIQEISIGAKLKGYKIENLQDLNRPVVLSYDFEGPEYFTLAGNLRIMPQLSALDNALVAKDARKYDLDLNILESREIEFEIALPDNFELSYLPEGVAEDSPWLSFNSSYAHKGNKIIFQQRSEFKKRIIPKAEYPEFKQFFQRLAKRLKQRAVLEKLSR